MYMETRLKEWLTPKCGHVNAVVKFYGHQLIWTIDTFLCPESHTCTLIYHQPRFTDTGYLPTFYD